MNWFDANDLCNTEGGKLVEINSEEENEALVKEIKKNRFVERNRNFWIGLSDLRNQRTETTTSIVQKSVTVTDGLS